MKYQITITKIEEKTKTRKGDWTIVDKRPWTPEEYAKHIHDVYDSRGVDFLSTTPLKEVRDYAPDRTETVDVEVELLKQTVETLDLGAVIKAINGL